MDFSSDDIILAVSSPPGRSARGLIRASGEGVFELCEGLLEIEQSDVRTRGIRRARLKLWNDLTIDCLVLSFPGPRSYAGEDTIELILPGNPDLLERVIDWLIERARSRGLFARRAEAGEFTARAYLHGRMSLTEAEGVNALISARSDAELRAATLLTSGGLGDLADSLAEDLSAALALVEAGIDFTDQEDVVAIAPAELLRRLQSIAARIDDHLQRAMPFEALQAIPWVVIAGPPNAGKSMLFNALLGRQRAVVSPIAGTTRDVIAEPLALESNHGAGREVMLVDIAGLDDSDESFLNSEMQSAAQRALERAELILRCVPADERNAATNGGGHSARELVVLTKCDLVPDSDSAEVAAGVIPISAISGFGLNRLREEVAARIADHAVSLAADALALLPRHESALRNGLRTLHEAIGALSVQGANRSLMQPEIIASLLRLALDELGSLAGAVTPDEILGRIFAGFCIGK